MESTLSLAKADLEKEVALFLGYETDPALRGARETEKIESVVKSGLRQFYYPPPIQGVMYDWSFLKPTASLAIASGSQTVTLPDDFAGFEGKITLADEAGSVAIDLVSEGQVRARYADSPDATGKPELFALRPKKHTTGLRGQRQELVVFPETDAAYTLEFQYYLLPDALDGSRPYAYGGMAHAETILESCLAIAEERLDDASGIHAAKFQERLMASIALDRRNKPQHLGYNRDRSDNRYRRDHRLPRVVTVGGVEY